MRIWVSTALVVLALVSGALFGSRWSHRTDADTGGYRLNQIQLVTQSDADELTEFLAGLDPSCNVDVEVAEISSRVLVLYACP